MTASIDPKKVSHKEAKIAENPGEDYERYKITEDGVSPLAFPGTSEAMVKTSSYEHIEAGYTTEDPEEIVEMQDKRMRKSESIAEDVLERDPVNSYGEEDAKNMVLTWGSTKGAILDAMKSTNQPIKLVQPVYLKPFPSEEILEQMNSADKVACVETNATGQLADLVRKETLSTVDEKILKYDMRPFNPPDLAERLEEVF